jgi:hypothetical protein
VDYYAVIPHHPDFAPTGGWTIEFFIKPALFHQDHGGTTNVGGPFWTQVNTNLAYTIQRCETVNCNAPDFDQIFILGDGGKRSHFERISSNQSRFYKVQRYELSYAQAFEWPGRRLAFGGDEVRPVQKSDHLLQF